MSVIKKFIANRTQKYMYREKKKCFSKDAHCYSFGPKCVCLNYYQIPMEAPWDAPKAKEWDSMTVKEFLDNNVWTA